MKKYFLLLAFFSIVFAPFFTYAGTLVVEKHWFNYAYQADGSGYETTATFEATFPDTMLLGQTGIITGFVGFGGGKGLHECPLNVNCIALPNYLRTSPGTFTSIRNHGVTNNGIFTAPMTPGLYHMGFTADKDISSWCKGPNGKVGQCSTPFAYEEADITITPSSACSDSLNNDSQQGIDTLDPECHTDCNVNNAISYVPTHNSESVGPNGSCGSTETNTVNIGLDNSLVTKTKSVTLQSGQSTLSDTIYLSSSDWNALTAGKCSLKKRNGASWDYVPSVEYFSENTGTFSYTVAGLTAGTHEYQYECKKASWASDPVTKVSASATITVAAYVGTPVVSCTPSPQASPATFNWSASGFTNQASVVCTVDGQAKATGVASGSFSKSSVGSYAVNCTDGTQSQSASCSVTPGAPSCGDGVCTGAESCSSCASDCGACAPLTLGATCNPTPTVPVLKVNENFNVAVNFVNTGSKPWNPSAESFNNNSISSFSNWDGITRPLTTYISGTPSSGTFSSSFNLTAHSRPGTYPLSFRMSDVNGYFGSACLVNGDGNIQVRYPECSDGVDNADAEDTLVDSLDPGCMANSVYDPNDDDEQDASLGVVLKISAKPQLVRQGGSATVTYQVNDCSISGGAATWLLKRDGIVVASGTGNSSGEQTYPVTNIQSKTSFVVGCGGSVKTVSISLIKVQEF
jgi:hypothetical protein